MTMTIDKQNIEPRLRELDEQHRDDGDGGYTLLIAILTYERQLLPQQSFTLRQKLLEKVASRDVTLWGVALEAVGAKMGSRDIRRASCAN